MIMTDMNTLENAIQEKLAAMDQRKRQHQENLHEKMTDYEQRRQQYTTLADRLVRETIEPRLKKLAEHFDNMVFLERESGQHTRVCCFQQTARFPARAKLELAISRDGQYERLFLIYRLEILPVFFAYEGSDQVPFPLERVDAEKVAAWVDAKLLGFLEAYLRVETVDEYQRDNMVTDPVCGMQINKVYAAAQAEFQGQTYYFCVQECKDKFAANPAAFVEGAGRAGGKQGTVARAEEIPK
jgi:YHS domain-containing protein